MIGLLLSPRLSLLCLPVYNLKELKLLVVKIRKLDIRERRVLDKSSTVYIFVIREIEGDLA